MSAALQTRTVTLTDEWQPLAAVPTVLDTEVIAHADNAGPALIRFDGLPEGGATWPAGVQARLGAVDQARVEVRGEPGDTLAVIGRTRQ